MTTETETRYIVSYYDPDRPVDGNTKTRHFYIEDDARDFLTYLPTMAPGARNIKLEKRVTTIRKEILFRG